MDDRSGVPVLVTERLVLRAFASTDLDALAAIYADVDVMRYIKGGVRSYAQTEASLKSAMRAWDVQGYGLWAVTRRADGTLLGICGFVARAEIGYILGRASWGQGYATEAADACLRYGFASLGFAEIGAGTLADNLASRHIIEKLGFRREPNAFFDNNGGVYYQLRRKVKAP